MNRLGCVFLGLLWPAILLANVAPVVTNVQAAQQPLPSELVQITYDVSDADNDTMTVSLQISSDGGATWTVPISTVSGDVGDSILSGVNYQIIWNAGVDYPEQTGTQYKAKVLAGDHKAPAGMVLIPTGPYVMGSNVVGGSATPEHTVNVPAFCMDIYEVTNAQYKAFCDATAHAYPSDPGFSGMPNYFISVTYANYPVVNVSWDDTRAYATWAGKRLPTEAEWERAAKGNTDNRQYPWGDTWIAANANIANNPADGYEWTSPVGSYPNGISPTGCYDMIGNVYERCEDDYHSNYSGAPTDGSAWIDNPRGPYRVGRGGWYMSGYSPRCADRGNMLLTALASTGFRCSSGLALGSGVSPLFSLDTRPPVPQPCTNLAANFVAPDVVLTWTDPTQDTFGRPITIDNVEVWLGAAESGSLLAIVDPGVQTYTHHKNENGCHYCVRALAGEYYSTSECVETQDLCDTTGIARNMALECGTGYGIGQVGGSPPALAMDNNLLSAWYTESTTGRLVVTLRTLCALDNLVLHIATYPDGNAQHIVSISSDSSQWQTLLDTTAYWTDGQRLVILVSWLDSVKYISLYTPNSVSYVAWYEVQAFGTPIVCRATLSIVPSSLDFGIISCGSSAVRSVQLNNPSAVPVPVLDLFNSSPDFLPNTALIGSWIAPLSNVTLTVQCQPLSEGTLRDTLRVVSQLAGADTLQIPMMAIVPSVPAAPESLVVERGAGTNINIYWAPVTHSICGNPLTPSQYRIFAATSANGPFTQIATSATNSYVHPFILNAQSVYFYRVTADVATRGARR